jgi:hypothetical protein
MNLNVGKVETSAIDASDGIPGLTLLKLNLKNVANTVTSFFTNTATLARTWTLPDKDGTVAMTSDITGGTSAGSFTTVASNIATGTAPFTVASTTVVTNLNADMLDGRHVGTSGDAIPSLGGANNWVNNNSFNGNSGSANVNISNAGAGVGLGVDDISMTGQLTSTLVTGTAPFTVASTTPVANLIAQSISGGSYAQSSGLSTAWGTTGGVSTGAYNAIMGTGANATWLLSGTSGGVFRAGIQVLDSNGALRIHSGAYHLDFSGNVLQADQLQSWTTTVAPLIVASSIKVTNLNADQLDGLDSTDLARFNSAHTTATPDTALNGLTSGDANIDGTLRGWHWLTSTNTRGGGYGTQLAMSDTYSGLIKYRNKVAGVWGSWGNVWTDMSDGATSGLDADLLDGQHGAYYAPLAAPAFTGSASAVDLTISGTLTVNGTVSTINSTTLTVDDKNIELGSVAVPSDATADGGGITLKGATDKTITWVSATNKWTSSHSLSAPSYYAAAVTGNGYGLWQSSPITYGMSMSDSANVSNGGRMEGETTSDYNMYFGMSAGTNRGFIFRTSYGVNQFAINPDAVRSNVPLTLGSSVKFENADVRFKSGNTAAGYGVIARNDGAYFYLLTTNNGDANGAWNVHRPFSFNLAQGYANMGGGVYITGGLNLNSTATPGQATGVPSTNGGTMAATTTYAKIVALDLTGAPTLAGAESLGVVTTGATASIVWTWVDIAGAASYRVYVGATGAQGNYFTTTSNTFTQILPSASGTALALPAQAYTGSITAAGDITTNRYLFSNYVNMTHSAAAANADTVFYSSTDNYIRKNTAVGFKTSLALNNVTNESKVTMFANPGFSGLGNFTGTGAQLPASTTLASQTTASAALMVTSQGTGGTAGASFMTFHRPGNYAVHFGLDNDSVLKVGGYSMGAVSYKIWHEGIDGADSGLDADLLDGQQGSYYNDPANLSNVIPPSKTSQFIYANGATVGSYLGLGTYYNAGWKNQGIGSYGVVLRNNGVGGADLMVASNAGTVDSAATIVYYTFSTTGNFIATTLQSNVVTGTAPLTVASTTVVTNLNADLLDGQDGTYYSPAIGSASIVTTGTIATGTWNATAIADGKIATALTGKTYNGLTVSTATANTIVLTNGTTTLTANTTGTIGSAAYTASTAYATAAQGTKADNAAPAAGPTFTGVMTLPAGAGTNTIKAGTGDGASTTVYNVAVQSWWGIGFRDHTDAATVKAYIDCRSGIFAGTQLQSIATQGTAPLIVASTTLVTSLNADQLDGQHGSYYAPNVITGYVSGAGTVAATDTILQAINKLDGNVAGKQASGTYVTPTTLNNSTLPARVTTLNASGITRISVADGVYQLGISGTTKGLRFVVGATGSSIEGVDNTLSTTYQPLNLSGSIVNVTSAGGLTVTGAAAVTGGVDKLTTASGTVSVAAATAPTTGQMLVATSATTATWQTVGGGATLTDDVATNTTQYLGMSRVTTGSWTSAYVATTKLYFNPSTGTLNSTVFNSLSDSSKKTNIVTVLNATDTIKKLSGVEFNWKDTGLKSAGVIAQDIEDVLPWLVDTNEDGIKSVNYAGLSAYLIESIKQLNARLEILEKV